MDAFEYLNSWDILDRNGFLCGDSFLRIRTTDEGEYHKLKAYLKNREQQWKDSDELKCNSCYEQGSTYEVLFIVFSNSLHF